MIVYIVLKGKDNDVTAPLCFDDSKELGSNISEIGSSFTQINM
jgi:hypothetical protein